MDLLEAFDNLNRLNESIEPDWVTRIHKCIEKGTLDLLTLEEFISEHEKEEKEVDPKLLDITNKEYNYKKLLQDELLGQDGWTRTDIFNSYAGNTAQLLNELQAKIDSLDAEYYVEDSDGMFIIMRDSDALRDWLNYFDSIQEVVDFLAEQPNNITSDFGYHEINNDEDVENLCYELTEFKKRRI